MFHVRTLLAKVTTRLTRCLVRHLDTEIDWETYMIQTKLFLQGEHNYSRITGPTGPLVYVDSLLLHVVSQTTTLITDILPVMFEYTSFSMT